MKRALLGIILTALFAGAQTASAQTCSTQGISDVSLRGQALPPKFLSLTYDDGPDTYSLQLATYIKSQGIRTTFFIRGCHVPNYPVNLASYVALGHRVATHTQTHPHLVGLFSSNPSACLSFTPKYLPNPTPSWDPELTMPDVQLSTHISDGVYLLRTPGGSWNDDTINISTNSCGGLPHDIASEVRDLIGRNCATNPTLGQLFGPVHWDYDSADWDCFGGGSNLSVAACASRVMDSLNAAPSPGAHGIILFHDWLQYSGDANAKETAPPTPPETMLDCVLANERQVNMVGTPDRYKGDDKSLQLAQTLVPMLKSQGYQIVSTDAIPGFPGGQDYGSFDLPSAVWQSEFSDTPGGWADPGLYSSIRYVDIDSDGYTDVCARTFAGIACGLNNRAGRFGLLTTRLSSSQLQGLPLDDLHSRTIQFADVNGDARPDVCWLTNSTIYCALQNATGSFNTSANWTAVGLFSGFESPQYASSLYIGPLGLNPATGHNDVGVCGRGIDGVHCAVSNGTSFGAWGAPWAAGFSDGAGWDGVGYYPTIRFADVTGDGVVDVCGEGFQSVFCATGDLANKRFINFTQWTSWGRYLSDYTDDLHNASIRLAKTGLSNGSDLCIRVGIGEMCAPNVSGSFDPFKVVYKAVSDVNGWGDSVYGTTVEFVPNLTPNRAGNPVSICGRGIDGIHCAQHK
jgi:peptidoglycan/xylan/chitin deacetylase (PgdA/CDA1 family)